MGGLLEGGGQGRYIMTKIGREREDPKVHFQIDSFKSRKTGPM